MSDLIFDEIFICKYSNDFERKFTLYKYNKYGLLDRVLETDLNAWRENVNVHIYIYEEVINGKSIYTFTLKFDSCILFDNIEFDKLFVNNQEVDLDILSMFGLLKNMRGDTL